MILNVPLLPFLIVSPKISFDSRNLFKFVRNYIVQFFCFALTFELECVCTYIYSREKYKKPVVTFEFSFMENLGELCRHVANISHARKEWRGATYSGTYPPRSTRVEFDDLMTNDYQLPSTTIVLV